MNNSQDGILFEETDYQGILKRFLIQIIDFVVVALIVAPFIAYDDYRYQNYLSDQYYKFTFIGLVLCYLYLTIIKVSNVGTLGQLITKSRVLNIRGKRPTILAMTIRLLFWVFGPFNFIVDIAFISHNYERRSLRDSICNTIVVKKNAKPIRENVPIKIVRAYFFGFQIMYETASNS